MMILALHPAGLTKSLVSRKRKGGRKRRGWRRLEERQVDKGICGTGVAVKLLCLPLMEKNMVYVEDRRHISPQALPPMGQNSYVPRVFWAWGQAAGGKVRLIGALAGLSRRTREGSCCPDLHLSVHSVVRASAFLPLEGGAPFLACVELGVLRMGTWPQHRHELAISV